MNPSRQTTEARKLRCLRRSSSRETLIPAPPATVFAFLTDPEKILSWMGAEASTETHPGGLYLVKGVGGRNTARGTFREVVPVHRLAYQFRLGG